MYTIHTHTCTCTYTYMYITCVMFNYSFMYMTTHYVSCDVLCTWMTDKGTRFYEKGRS